jgi:hypothetical protein
VLVHMISNTLLPYLIIARHKVPKQPFVRFPLSGIASLSLP